MNSDTVAGGFAPIRVTIAALLFGLGCVAGGCATVQPWERQTLAHECMANPVNAWDQAYFGHVAAVREGSAGGTARGGGGCGCN